MTSSSNPFALGQTLPEGEEVAVRQGPIGLAVVASDRATASGESKFGQDEGEAVAGGLGLVAGMVRHAHRVRREGFAEESESGLGCPLHGPGLWTELSQKARSGLVVGVDTRARSAAWTLRESVGLRPSRSLRGDGIRSAWLWCGRDAR